MCIRSSFVLLICFISSLTLKTDAFLWGSSAASAVNNVPNGVSNGPSNEKPAISLSCLLYGEAGCQRTCQLTSMLYGAETNPECRDNLYCFCNEVYHLPGGDLTADDFQKLSFDTLWDNIFENTSQANAIRRYIKKNDQMKSLVDSLIRDPRVSGDEIKNQLMFTYPELSSEFKKLISVKRGIKTDLMTGDHLKYEDILDHFNELVAGIQNSDNELQNIKYRRRIAKILESIKDENELSHLVDLVKLTKNESLYNYVTSVLKKRGYVFDSDTENSIPPMVKVFSEGGLENEVHTTNVIREHSLSPNEINEEDLIELSVITKLSPPSSNENTFAQINNDGNSEAQTSNVAYSEEQIPANTEYNNMVAFPDLLAQIQANGDDSLSLVLSDMLAQIPATDNRSLALSDILVQLPANGNDNQSLSQSNLLVQIPTNGNENQFVALSDLVAQMPENGKENLSRGLSDILGQIQVNGNDNYSLAQLPTNGNDNLSLAFADVLGQIQRTENDNLSLALSDMLAQIPATDNRSLTLSDIQVQLPANRNDDQSLTLSNLLVQIPTNGNENQFVALSDLVAQMPENGKENLSRGLSDTLGQIQVNGNDNFSLVSSDVPSQTQANGNDNQSLSLPDILSKIQTELSNLAKEVSQLKSSSFGVDLSGMSRNMFNDNFSSGNGQTQSELPKVDQSFGMDFAGIAEILDTTQNSTFEDSVSAVANALLKSSSQGDAPDASQVQFLNSIPTYLAQVAAVPLTAVPITFPDGVTVSKMMKTNSPSLAEVQGMPLVAAIAPDAIENSVQYTISKKIKMMKDAGQLNGDSSSITYDSGNSFNNVSLATPSPDNVVTIYSSADSPNSMSTATQSPSSVMSISSNSVPGTTHSSTSAISTYNSADTPNLDVIIQDSADSPDGGSVTAGDETSDWQMLISTSEARGPAQMEISQTTNAGSHSATFDSGSSAHISQTNGDQSVLVNANLGSPPSESVAIKSVSPKKARLVSTSAAPKNQIATTESVTSKNTPTSAPPKNQIARTESVTSTNNPRGSKNQIATTETITSTNTVDAAKPTKITRKTSSTGKEIKTSQSVLTPADTDTIQTSVSQSSPGDMVTSFDETEQAGAELDEALTVTQSASKGKKTKRIRDKKSTEQFESSSMVRSLSPEVQADDSAISIAAATQTGSSVTKDENKNNLSYGQILGNVNEEKAPPTVQIEESSSPFGRFGLDQVRKFANGFKKSPSF